MKRGPEDIPTALTIAGFDPSGGAGIQADLKTFHAFDVYGASVVSCLTLQTTSGVQGVLPLPFEIVRRQLGCVFEDLQVDAVKVGMLGTGDVVRAVARVLHDRRARNVVLDPLVKAKNGHPLLDPNGVEALVEVLIPLCTLVTPNAPETEVLTGVRIEGRQDVERSIQRLHELGAKNVLLKGGHLRGSDAVDYLSDGRSVTELRLPAFPGEAVHGTGCTLSSAVAAMLARGAGLREAVQTAKAYTHRAIEHSLKVGRGNPVPNHWVPGIDSDA